MEPILIVARVFVQRRKTNIDIGDKILRQRSLTNLGNKKGVPSKPYNQKYVYLSSIYNFPFPFRKSIDSFVIGVGTSPMKISLHLLKNES